MTTKTQSPCILLVEDDDNHATLAELALDDCQLGCDFVRVSDGIEAMAYLRKETPFEEARRPDLVLLDLHLPRMDGHAVLGAIRAEPRFAGVPIVVLTTSESETDIRRAYQQAVNSYLVKPVDFESFNRLIHDMGFYWTTWNRTVGGFR